MGGRRSRRPAAAEPSLTQDVSDLLIHVLPEHFGIDREEQMIAAIKSASHTVAQARLENASKLSTDPVVQFSTKTVDKPVRRASDAERARGSK